MDQSNGLDEDDREYEGMEDLGNYKEGGFHPVEIGDIFNNKYNNKYQIINNLGHGSYSTVWLARDFRKQRNISLKIMKADHSKSHGTTTAKKLRRQQNQSKTEHKGKQFLLSHEKEFRHKGPNGTHLCLVNEVVGPTIPQLKDILDNEKEECLLPVATAKKFTVQIAHGLTALYDCGIMHGDLHPDNIAVKVHGLEHWSTQEIKEKLGEPIKVKTMRQDGESRVPGYRVVPISWGRLGKDSFLNSEIRILDFGEATSGVGRTEPLKTSYPYRAPEAYFEPTVGFPADIWAFGCVVFELFDDFRLINCSSVLSIPGPDRILFEMVGILGRLPPQWWDSWKEREKWIDENGERSSQCKVYSGREWPQSLDKRITHMRPADQLNSHDAAGLVRVLQECLEYEPTRRATAQRVYEICKHQGWDKPPKHYK